MTLVPTALMALGHSSRGEIYPLSRWPMFSRIDSKVKDFGLKIHSVGSRRLAHPKYFEKAGSLYLELFAFIAVFRPRLHRPWALGLILFHVGSGLVLGIGFPNHVLLLGICGLASPFAAETQRWGETLSDLPLFGDLFRLFRARGTSAA